MVFVTEAAMGGGPKVGSPGGEVRVTVEGPADSSIAEHDAFVARLLAAAAAHFKVKSAYLIGRFGERDEP